MLRHFMLALSLTGLLTVPAFAQGEVVIDYNDGAVLDMADPAQWSGIAAEIGEGGVVLGEVRGSFLSAGSDEVAYLLSDSAPAASDPFPQLNQRLVIFEGETQSAMIALDDGAFGRPVGAVDVDGDGIDEVILEGSFYNMGTSAIGLSVVKLGETAEVIQTLPEVFVDSCDAGVGEKSISASVVSLSDGQLVAETETMPCP